MLQNNCVGIEKLTTFKIFDGFILSETIVSQ